MIECFNMILVHPSLFSASKTSGMGQRKCIGIDVHLRRALKLDIQVYSRQNPMSCQRGSDWIPNILT